MAPRRPPPGWYHDPAGQFDNRYWDGWRWSAYVARGGQMLVDSPAAASPSDIAARTAGEFDAAGTAWQPEQFDRLSFVRCFLDDAERHGLLDTPTHATLVDDVASRMRALTPRPPTPESTVARPVESPSPAAPLPPAPAPPVEPAPESTPPLVPPGALRAWWDDVRRAVVSDLAVHGLAYLGVLLLFAGVFGLVAFAFGQVRIGLRPLAELAIPVALFGAAWFLHRRGSPFVAQALEFLAGAVLPVVLLASFLDDAAVPPDPEGGALLASLAAGSTLLAVGYAGASARRPATSLRYLAAPMLWLAVGAAGYATSAQFRVDPSARPVPGQVALVAAAVLLSLAWCRQSPGNVLARPTEIAAMPALALVQVLGLFAAAAEGWPAIPVAVTGLSVLASIELLAPRFEARAVAVLQALVLGVTILGLEPALGPGWAGAVAVAGYLGLAEWQGLRRPSAIASAASLGGVAIGLAISFGEPWAAVAKFTVASAWANWRRLRPPAWAPNRTVLTAAAAILPAGAAWGLLAALPAPDAVLVLGALVAAAAAAVRLARAGNDALWQWWIPSAAGLVVFGTALQPIEVSPAPRALAAGLAAVALVLAPRWPALRIWSASAAAAWASFLAFQTADAATQARVGSWAIVGVGLAALALVLLAAVWRSPIAGHVGLVGHVAGAAALVSTPWSGWVPVGVLGAFVAGWVATTVVQETARSPVGDLLQRLARRVGGEGTDQQEVRGAAESLERAAAALPALLSAISFPALVVLVVDRVGIVSAGDPWAGAGLSAVALAYVTLALAMADRRHLALLLPAVSFWVALAAILVAVDGSGPAATTTAAAICTVLLLGRDLRQAYMVWCAWALSAALSVLVADLLDAPPGWWHYVLLCWGAVAVAGALAWDDLRGGRRVPGQWVREPWLRPPVVLGAAAVPVGLAPAIADPFEVLGWWCLGVAALALVVAVQLRAGAVTFITYALATISLITLAPFEPMERPWTLVLWAGALAGVAFLLRQGDTAEPRSPWLRWDVAPFVAAHGVALLALVAAASAGSVPTTWVATGALSIAVSAWRRHAVWLVSGAGLILIGAGAAGPGWLAAALLGTSVLATAFATRATGTLRTILQVVGVSAAACAWASYGVWQRWSPELATTATAVAAGALALATGAATRYARLARDWATWWGATALVGLGWAATSLVYDDLARRPAGLGLALGLALASAGTATAAGPVREPWMRDAAALLLALAAAPLAYGLDLTVPGVVALTTAAGLGATIAVMALWTLRPSSPWVRPCTLLGVLMVVTSVSAASTELPSRDLLVATLLLAGAESAAVGLAYRRLDLLVTSPTLLCAAWVTFASEALAGNPQWFTVPIGLAVLVIVGLARWRRRVDRQPVSTPELVTLEELGMAFLVGSSLAQTVVEHTAYGLLGAALGCGLTVWGALTRVRRRALTGIGVTLLALALMAVAPVFRPAARPELGVWRGLAPWLALAAAGVVVLVAATLLEQGRVRIRRAVRRLSDLTQGWE